MPISYERRKRLRLEKAIAVMKPYVLRCLLKTESPVLDKTVADPLAEGVRKHFYGLRGNKGEVCEILNKLSVEDFNTAIIKAIQHCLESEELQKHLKERAASRQAYLDGSLGMPVKEYIQKHGRLPGNIASQPSNVLKQPTKKRRPKLFKPLDQPKAIKPKLDMHHDTDVIVPEDMDAHRLRLLIKALA